MLSLFRFLYRFRAFLLFLFYEFIAFWLIFNHTTYQSSAYFNFTKEVSGNLYAFTNGFKEYLSLKNINDELAAENILLRKKVENFEYLNQFKYALNSDSALLSFYEYIPAKVINNSTQRVNNLITVNRGLAHGIIPGMGVISSNGVVGRVKICSDNFSTIVSVLHSESMISAKIKNNNSLGSIVWEDNDFRYAYLKYIPRHIKVAENDSIVTTGFSSVYPENVMIGTVESVKLDSDKNFHKIKIKLSTNFSGLGIVYVVKNLKHSELDSLNKQTQSESY
jgi:rod shape-determining protein MreC